MPYIPHTEEDIKRILKAAGAASVEDLLESLPGASRLISPLALPPGLSEQELKGLLEGLGEANAASGASSFLGAGAYNHYIPSVVDHVISRSEFYTSYTPYQPEVSQGTLQAIFEYQTLVCQLTGMDVSNASLYDGATSVAEAVLMARRITKRNRVVLSGALHPEYADTVRTYFKGLGDSLEEVMFCTERGTTLAGAVSSALDESAACLVVQHPNFFGSLEELEELAGVVHSKGALLVVAVTEPVSLGLLKPPGALGADIVVGEMQSFGNPLSYGGPHLGFMSTKEAFVRQMPGRIIGRTVDRDGNRAFCLTFSTREQHIRRERATSNICTNHGLNALAASVHLVALGRTGLKGLARTNLQRAAYLRKKLGGIPGVEQAFTSPVFNEFTIRVDADPDKVLKTLLRRGIVGGLPLKRFHETLPDHLLVAVTEMNSPAELDRFSGELSKALG